jgi:hypothetical protein
MNLPTGTGDDLLRVAAVQMNSRDDKAVNIQTTLELIDRATFRQTVNSAGCSPKPQ